MSQAEPELEFSNVTLKGPLSFNGGYIKLNEVFRVGSDLAISMDIKTSNCTGVLLSVHGKKTFFIGEMVDGSVKFSVDSGDGPRTVTLSPESGSSFCDGQWHSGELLDHFDLLYKRITSLASSELH
jgi:laminin alpha 3/5